jgi:hypothetical protein
MILLYLAGLLSVDEVMRLRQMNAIKNKLLYLFIRVVSLLLAQKHSIHFTGLGMQMFNLKKKLKLGKILLELHFCMCVWFGGFG